MSGAWTPQHTQRLEQLYGGAAELTFLERPGGGTIARIEMPFQSRAELRDPTAIVDTEGE